jgi:ATP-dependent protease HslVU (ClpYQ) peptidase subunit
MTCIVGLVDNGEVYIGGDSAAVYKETLSMTIRADEKVFKNGEYIIGCTTSFRMIDLLRYKLSLGLKSYGVSDTRHMATAFIDAVRKCFNDNGFGTPSEGGGFLVGYHGNLYSIAPDFQVGLASCGYDAVGCGADIALGAMFACKEKDPIKRINVALRAASTFSAGVRPPFHVVMQRAGE